MYKLLVTTALVAMTATSASAWDNADDVITNLEGIYSNLDGGGQFNTLQKTGELFTFIDTVNKGVTHLALSVDGNQQITATLNKGTTLDQIQLKADDLVNRVNYDLFVDPDGTGTGYVNGTDYTLNQNDLTITPVENTDPNEYESNHGTGLLGIKVGKLVDGVNDINTILVSTGDNASRDGFITAWEAGTGTISDADGTVDIAVIQGHITNLNDATAVISTDGTGSINDNVNDNGLLGGALTSGNVNAFNVPGIQADGKVVIAGGTEYQTLYDWAIATTP